MRRMRRAVEADRGRPRVGTQRGEAVPLDGDARPLSKEAQLQRGPKRPKRQVAGGKRKGQMREAKQGPCRICGKLPPNELHHLISRAQGGADTEANLVPLCQTDHAFIEARDPIAGMILASSLTDEEYSYAVYHYGEGFFERRLGIVYARALTSVRPVL